MHMKSIYNSMDQHMKFLGDCGSSLNYVNNWMFMVRCDLDLFTNVILHNSVNWKIHIIISLLLYIEIVFLWFLF